MNTRNPQDIREGQEVVFLSNPAAGTYFVTRVWSTGKVDLVVSENSVVPFPSAQAKDLVQADHFKDVAWKE